MPSVSDNADFSSYRDGHYFFAGQAAHNYVNNPISNPGFLLSFRYDVHTLQLVFDHAVRELYVRGSTDNATWQSWRKVLFTDSSVPTPDSDAKGNEIVNAEWVASYIWERFEHSVTSGWARHNAAVLNWGTGGTSTTTKIVFPHAYQSTGYVVLVTPHGASSTSGANNQCVVGEKTTTGCTIYSNNAGVAFNYFAIGV